MPEASRKLVYEMAAGYVTGAGYAPLFNYQSYSIEHADDDFHPGPLALTSYSSHLGVVVRGIFSLRTPEICPD